MENCRSADVFAGSLNGTAPGSQLIVPGRTSPNVYLDPSVSDCGTAPCPWDFRISNAFLNAKPLVGDSSLNAEIASRRVLRFLCQDQSRGHSLAVYAAIRARQYLRLEIPRNWLKVSRTCSLRFGIDTDARPDGRVDDLPDGSGRRCRRCGTEVALDAAWSRVLSVRVGMLIRSPDRAGAPDRTHTVIDVDMTPSANDGAIREVYETTVALRNRLFKS